MENKNIVKTIEMSAENYNHCKAIAEELEGIVNGDFVKDPRYDAEPVKVEEDERGRYAEIDGTIYREDPEDGEEDLADLEVYTVWDYFNDVFNIDWILDSNKEYEAVRLMIACGGPNIYVDTFAGKVLLYWWTDYAEYPLTREVIEAIDDCARDWFFC